jgi:serine/threonine protein kinase
MAAEAVALNTLAHPALVRGFGAQFDAPAPHLLLELLDGPRLSTVIRRVGHLSSDEVVRIAGQISAALHYLSSEGWIHLGITPRTIMMSGPPRLIDLGAARPVAVDRRRPGTIDPAYLAPEQIDPARSSEIGPPADVFALAATLFEALTGRPPFAPRPGLRYPQLTAERPVAPERTPALLGSLLRAALSPLPERRPTAAALHVTLDDLARSGRNARRLRHR